jgi:colicin import membrane protein
VQPIDLRVLRHDRREIQAINRDSACTAEPGRLSCSRGIRADSYTMWIVPESLAAVAGPEALQRAVAEGLSGPRSADLGMRR